MISSGCRPRLQGSLDMPASAWRVHVRYGCVEGDAHQLQEPRCEEAAFVETGSEGKELIRPGGRKLVERIPRGVPLTDRAHRIAGRSLRLWASCRFHSRRLHFLKQDGRAQTAGMNREPDATFQDEDDFIARRARVERSANLAAGTFFVEVRAGAIQREVDQLHFLARQNSASPRIRADTATAVPPLSDPIL